MIKILIGFLALGILFYITMGIVITVVFWAITLPEMDKDRKNEFFYQDAFRATMVLVFMYPFVLMELLLRDWD